MTQGSTIMRTVVLTAIAVVNVVGMFAGVVACSYSWSSPDLQKTPHEAFVSGSIGTEVIPLKVLAVLPGLFPDEFQPAGPEAGDWIDQYGFVRREELTDAAAVHLRSALERDLASGTPFGMTFSRYRPLSGEPWPVATVGIGCAACHTAEVGGRRVIGAGNQRLDIIAWGEALRAVVLKRAPDGSFVLTVDAVDDALHEAHGERLGLIERFFIGGWLRGFREAVTSGLATQGAPRVHPNDDPALGALLLRDSLHHPAGPGRTAPFRSLVRILLDQPGAPMDRAGDYRGFSKIPVVFHQDPEDKIWAQFDGTVRSPTLRSSLAALTIGSGVLMQSRPEIARNIQQAATYTLDLEAPRWEDVFGSSPGTDEQLSRGFDVYMQHCASCHGHRDVESGRYIYEGDELNLITPLSEIGTDPERIRFRLGERIPDAIFDLYTDLPPGLRERFPNGHPLAPASRDELRANDGYLNAPLDGAFLRAPFLHNGSVPTLSELIGLTPRRETFLRGANGYDETGVGIEAGVDASANLYWLFDARSPGNSNQGHEYPPRPAAGWSDEQRADLEALLVYLKSL